MTTEKTAEERLGDALENYIYFFNNLSSELDNINTYISNDIYFQDPFNKLSDIHQLKLSLQKFSASVKNPYFDVTHRAWSGHTCFIRWDFSGQLSQFGDWRFPGVSELHFDDDGKVCQHIDHWDAGEHFYQRLPVLGRLIKMIRRRI